MPRHIGTFGQEVEPTEGVAFGWFGKDVRSNPTLGELDYIEFMDGAASMDVENPASLRAIMSFARACIHPDDFAGFWQRAREHRQGSTELFDVLTSIVEAVTDRPTERPADSSGGPTTTGQSSAVASSLRVQRDFEARGRPDLALIVLDAREQREQGQQAG